MKATNMAKSRRVRRTYAQIFMDRLTTISNGDQRLIGNRALRDDLGWDEDRYNRIKTQLVEENAILVGRGKGGTVGLAKVKGEKELTAFICYSHEYHLRPVHGQNRSEIWHNGKIVAGD